MKQRLLDDMKAAMKSSNKTALDCLRMVVSQIKNEEIAARKEVGNDDVIRIIKKGIKSREDSIVMFEKGGRQDLVSKERQEVEILKRYLPAQMTQAQVEEIVAQKITETGATTKAQTGMVIKAVMAQCQGRAEGSLIAQIVASKLG